MPGRSMIAIEDSCVVTNGGKCVRAERDDPFFLALSHDDQRLAGLIDIDRFIACRIRALSKPISLAVAAADPIVPQVP